MSPSAASMAFPAVLGTMALAAPALTEEVRFAPDDEGQPAAPAPPIYATWQSFPLDPATQGAEGRLRLLEDSRVTRAGARRDWGVQVDPPEIPHARLQIVRPDGSIAQEELLALAVADLRVVHLAGDAPTYLLHLDHTCGRAQAVPPSEPGSAS